MRRVVVTGLGCVTPMANGVKHSWQKIINGESGISRLQGFEINDLSCQIGGQVPTLIDDSVTDESPLFNPNFYVPPREQKLMDPFMVFGLAAVHHAVKDAGLLTLNDESKERVGVMVGSGIGGLSQIYETSITLHEKGPRRVSPYFIVSSLINLASGFASLKYGFKGPNHACVTACATGTHAIGDAMRLIMMDDADIMIAGGAEASLNRLGVAGFSACKALSTNFNESPEKASRPWDKDRDGFIMGEGSGVLVLEELSHAKARGANIYAEVVGYGLSSDAHHYTAPPEDGNGAMRAMKNALKNAKLRPEDIDYINAHGTSTPLGDKAEVSAIKTCFEDHAKKLAISSTKSATGHLLGAAGGIEAIFAVLALKEGVLPPTLNLDNPDDGFDLDFVPYTARDKTLKTVMSNSFGFGGTNASLIFKAVE
ncbi:MAG: beta-ketoacyl-ACP synthase II [Proteobacteria bacterium]|nr:beta-ketoacyl-ACP synthase II [Pseudomonadota bacterium]